MSSPSHPASIRVPDTPSNPRDANTHPASIAAPAASNPQSTTVHLDGSPDEVAAAIKIQKVVRGHLSRRNSERQLRSGSVTPSTHPSTPRGSSAKSSASSSTKFSITQFFASLSPTTYIVAGAAAVVVVALVVLNRQQQTVPSKTFKMSTPAAQALRR